MRDSNITTAVGMYNAARLLLAEFSRCEEGSEETRKATCRSLIIPFAVVCILGIELALKSLIARQGSHYNKAHDLLELYNLIQPETQQLVEQAARADGVTNLHGVLRAHRNGLQEWRYLAAGLLASAAASGQCVVVAVGQYSTLTWCISASSSRFW